MPDAYPLLREYNWARIKRVSERRKREIKLKGIQTSVGRLLKFPYWRRTCPVSKNSAIAKEIRTRFTADLIPGH
jgi:hypothetical protein